MTFGKALILVAISRTFFSIIKKWNTFLQVTVHLRSFSDQERSLPINYLGLVLLGD